MSQNTKGIRSLLSIPSVYELSQRLVGVGKFRHEIVETYLRLRKGCRILDIGCGTATLLDYLPKDVEYVGFDLSPEYIASAKERYGDRGVFECKMVTSEVLEEYKQFDRVIACGVLHHLDDEEVLGLFRLAREALTEEDGMFFSIDPCFVEGQSIFSQWMISRDRGQNVRFMDEYNQLLKQVFANTEVHHKNDLLRIPYDHTILIAR